jgi:hypothetical protein
MLDALRNLDWSFINSFSGWLSAFGSLAAVVVALWLASRDWRIRLKVRVGIRKILAQGRAYKIAEEPDFLIISVINVGRRVATITGLLWKNRLARRYLFQMPGEAPISAQIPARLQDGDEADFVILLSGFLNDTDPLELMRVIPWPRIITIHFLRILVQTRTGEMVPCRLEKELRKRLVAFVKEKSGKSGSG